LLTPSQALPPAIVMDDDADVIRIVEGLCCAIERRIVEAPFRRNVFPDEPIKIAPVFAVAELAVFRGEVILAPPSVLSRRRQRCRFALRLVVR